MSTWPDHYSLSSKHYEALRCPRIVPQCVFGHSVQEARVKNDATLPGADHSKDLAAFSWPACSALVASLSTCPDVGFCFTSALVLLSPFHLGSTRFGARTRTRGQAFLGLPPRPCVPVYISCLRSEYHAPNRTTTTNARQTPTAPQAAVCGVTPTEAISTPRTTVVPQAVSAAGM